MPYNSNKYQLKSVYLPKRLASDAEKKAKKEYMNFSAYVRKLIVDDLKQSDLPNSVNSI